MFDDANVTLSLKREKSKSPATLLDEIWAKEIETANKMIREIKHKGM